MKKTKCNECKKELPKDLVICECSECYVLGAKRERKKEVNRILELIDEMPQGVSRLIDGDELKKRITGK